MQLIIYNNSCNLHYLRIFINLQLQKTIIKTQDCIKCRKPFSYDSCFVIVIIFSSLTLNLNPTAIAPQQEQQQQSSISKNKQTLSHAKQQQSFVEDLSFDIDNVTFSHHMAS